jgi:hypothetical protein
MAPGPCPDEGVNAIQFTLTVASQAHSGAAETVMLVAPPAAAMVPIGVSATWHFTGEGPVEVETVDELQPARITTARAAARNEDAREYDRKRDECGTGDRSLSSNIAASEELPAAWTSRQPGTGLALFA